MSEPRPLPKERESVTRKFKLGSLKGYVTVGHYDDGAPGEMFITVDKVGTFERGLCHALALVVSLALKRGVTAEEIADKLIGLKFEPAGVTGDKEIPMADSFADYVGKWLKGKYGKRE